MTAKSNLAHSVKDRLLNIAREAGEDFNHLLIRYALERFLYRLSQSDYHEQFVLKGAVLFVHWYGEPHRPTLDADFHGREELEVEELEEIIRKICELNVKKDGLNFLSSSVEGEKIRVEEYYQGVKIKLIARLGTAKIHLQLDVGFGDSLNPAPSIIRYPTLLEFPPPELSAYQPETTIAEKFQNMVAGGILNSRMKDYYDIWFLGREFEFEGIRLQKALHETFRRRKTNLPVKEPPALTKDFFENQQKQAQWTGFLGKLDLSSEELSLKKVVKEIRDFLMPATAAAVRKQPFKKRWFPGEGWK